MNQQIEEAVQDAMGGRSYWVVADISNHSFYPGKGHQYFDLIEKDASRGTVVAKLSAASWKAGSDRISEFERLTGQRFTSGIQVMVQVEVDYHPVYGLKAVLGDIDPGYTLGQLERERQKTLKQLAEECREYIQVEGDRFLTRNNSLVHRKVIQHIAILASSTSAGYGDFMHILRNNPFGY